VNRGDNTVQVASPLAPERIKMARARAIVGLDTRVMQRDRRICSSWLLRLASGTKHAGAGSRGRWALA
jgi:hypothetical protein